MCNVIALPRLAARMKELVIRSVQTKALIYNTEVCLEIFKRLARK